MKKKIFLLLMSFVFVLTLVNSGKKQTAFAQDNIIKNAKQIQTLQELSQIGIASDLPMDGDYILTDDIDIEGVDDFMPIGLKIIEEYSPLDPTVVVQTQEITTFTGSFNGDGHTISGLNFDKAKEIYNYGLFAHLDGASITNLNLTNVKIENNVVFSKATTNSKTIVAGGLAAVAENTLIENVQVNFEAVQSSTFVAAGRADFGGLLGRAMFGTKIKNTYVKADFNFELDTNKLQVLNVGTLVGYLNTSKVQNTIVTGIVKLRLFDDNETHNSVLNIGGNAGYILGNPVEMISTYSNITVDLEDFDLENFSQENLRIGALVGAVSDQLYSTPVKQSISYNVMIAKVLIPNIETDLQESFGNVGLYNKEGSVYTFLEKDDFEIFNENNEKNKSFSQSESYKWDLKKTWQFNASTLPSLQVFLSYETHLNLEKTNVNLAQATLPSELIVIKFDESLEVEGITSSFKYGKKVTVVIALIKDFDIYYSLESVEINYQTVITLGETNNDYKLSMVEPEGEEEAQILPAVLTDLETTKAYVFSFLSNSYNAGEISVTLSKVPYNFEVKTESSQKGMIRKKQAPIATEILQDKVSVANLYEYVAVPLNANFAFDKWFIEVEDEFGEPVKIELEQDGQFSQIGFEFGKGDKTPITENILKGGKLVASFTNNITKITLIVEERKTGENTKAGEIFNNDQTQQFQSSEIVSIVKGREITLVAKETKGYKFVGWYDEQNRLREKGTALTYLTNQDEDEITFSAVFEKESAANSLSTLWLILGGIGVAVIITTVVIIVKRKRGDNSYKNFY